MKILGIVVVVFFISLVLQCVEGPVSSISNHPATPNNAVPVTSRNIDSSLSTTGEIAIIEFYSEKCTICESLTWVIDSLSNTFGNTVFIGANNIDNDTLWKRYYVTSNPTYILFKSGEEVTRRSFTRNEPQVFDSLATLVRQLIVGTLIPDPVDTITPSDPINYLTCTDSTFETAVLQMGRSAMVLFHDTTVMSSVYMDSVVRSIAPLFYGKAVIAKVNVSEYPGVSDQYDLYSFPQVLFFRDSIRQGFSRCEGVVSGDTLIDLLEKVLSSKVVSLDSHNFSDSIFVKGRVAVVKFFSPTCSSCRTLAPVYEALADSVYGTALVANVDHPANDSLASSYTIVRWPTLVFFKDGVEYAPRLIGSGHSIDTLIARIRTGLAIESTLEKRR